MHTAGCLWECCHTQHFDISLFMAFNRFCLQPFHYCHCAQKHLDRSHHFESGTFLHRRHYCDIWYICTVRVHSWVLGLYMWSLQATCTWLVTGRSGKRSATMRKRQRWVFESLCVWSYSGSVGGAYGEYVGVMTCIKMTSDGMELIKASWLC